MERIKCIGCEYELKPNEGYWIVGEFGEWTGAIVYVCDAQCLIKWDASDSETGYPGTQAVNLAKALYDMQPRSCASEEESTQ